MKRRRPVRRLPLVALLAAFCAGVLVDWSLHKYGPPQPAADEPAEAHAADAPPSSGMKAAPVADRASVATDRGDRDRHVVATSGTGLLRVPIDDVKVESFKGGFAEHRGDRQHEAVDILAPRNTPIHAVEDGIIAKLFVSKQGGNTIYQYDPTDQFCYYYAHLERYADIHEGDRVSQGQVIGYVGTTGNAPANTPHLHFAVLELGDDHRWWKGKAIDPYLVFKDRTVEGHGH